jgi:hypothetical protein
MKPMMRKSRKAVFLCLMGIFLLAGSSVVEGSRGWGIGVILGEPTGLSLKFWSSRTTAIDAAAAWSFKGEGKFHLHMDYLFHNYRVFKVKRGKLPLYYGIGGRVKFEEETRVGIRIPVGVCYLFRNQPLDIFFEIVPVLDITPETDFDINASVGIRFFFK